MTFGEKAFASLKDDAAYLGRKLTRPEIISSLDKAHADATRRSTTAGIHPLAEQVYAAYPRREGGTASLAAISASIERDGLPLVLAKTKEYGEAVEKWPRLYRYSSEGRDLVPMPSTFFSNRRYLDDSALWHRTGGAPAPQKPADHPEPKNWQEVFPDFLCNDRPWQTLQRDSQEAILAEIARRHRKIANDLLNDPFNP